MGKFHTGFGYCGGHIPSFEVNYHVGVAFVNFDYDFVYGHNIQKTGKIETEAIDVIFIRPVFYGIHNIFANHAAFGSGIVSAA